MRLEAIPPQGAQEQALTPLERLKRRREELASATTRDFDVPGYDGDLVVRYKRLGFDAMRQSLFGSDAENDIERNAQFLIDACDTILIRDGDQLTPAAPGPSQWPELGAAFGLPDDATVRQLVLSIFGGNEHAVIDHADLVARWMRSQQTAEIDDLVGGS